MAQTHDRANDAGSVSAHAFWNDHQAVMLLIDPQSGAIVDANPAACAWYGWTHDELLAMRIDQINTLTAEEVRAEMAAARTKQRGVFAFRHRLADGTIREVEVYSVPIEVSTAGRCSTP